MNADGWGLGDAPITDMRELIVMQGIWAAGAKLPDEISGLFFAGTPASGRFILVNHEQVRARKRFSYAHEYAHAILDHKRVATVTSKSNATEFIEKRANAFAAAFLMPRAASMPCSARSTRAAEAARSFWSTTWLTNPPSRAPNARLPASRPSLSGT
jgi:Zn-dependent peptidase ImmA (M78 family)